MSARSPIPGLDRAPSPAYAPGMHRIFTTPFATVHALYVKKV